MNLTLHCSTTIDFNTYMAFSDMLVTKSLGAAGASASKHEVFVFNANNLLITDLNDLLECLQEQEGLVVKTITLHALDQGKWEKTYGISKQDTA